VIWTPKLNVPIVLCCALVFMPPSYANCQGSGNEIGWAVLEGEIVLARDGSPIQFANIILEGTRLGASSDERGRFRLVGIDPGPRVIKIQTFASGDTIRRTYRVVSQRRERYEHIRDSLTARRRWPPTLDSTLSAGMYLASHVTVLRLDPDHPVFPAPADFHRYVGPWPIVAENANPDSVAVAELLDALRDTSLYLPDIWGDKKLCGGFQPGVAARFEDSWSRTDIALCFKCGEFSIWSSNGPRQSGDFEGQAATFVRFAKAVFPRDTLIQSLDLRRYGPPRR
jgi:hypothetical protein